MIYHISSYIISYICDVYIYIVHPISLYIIYLYVSYILYISSWKRSTNIYIYDLIFPGLHEALLRRVPLLLRERQCHSAQLPADQVLHAIIS